MRANHHENREERVVAMRQYFAEHREENRLYCKAYHEEHRAELNSKARTFYHATKEKNAENRRKYRSRTKAYRSRKNKEYREQNRDALNAYTKEWRKNNRARHRELAKRSQERRKNDPVFKLVRNLRRCVHGYLTRVCAKKAGKTIELVGCTKQELMIHLQGQFREGMNWNNYGPVWHVDHIRALSRFNMLDETEQRRAFHYTNLQPLFALENLSKGNR